uniref:NADH:ubiquinone reductase (H(+)-translocating) n=1 Tax=Neofoleyellides sp. XM-2022 TaxID=3014012 RepID=A0A9E9JLL2_9BILA|nr:NADH dehydrogenase subunit 5 [Neofoleyellides sp. XM-2022]
MVVFVWYIFFFYFLFFLLLFFLPYGKWVYCFGKSDFFTIVLVNNLEISLFLFVLLLVSFMIFIYGSFYMSGVNRIFYFFLVLFLFVLSMGGLIVFSGCILLTLVFWDFLGMSSFFLVLFYGNLVSRCGAMSTVFTNRVGDFCIFLFFNGFVFFSLGLFSYQFFGFMVSFMLLLSSFIKGGQYPFGGWLPKAMAAPTPVSCLVHSSTLVTAGVMLMDFYSFVSISSVFLFFVFFVGFFTLVFSGLCGLLEMDVKKLVALSTMSQIGFCFMSIGCGFHYVSFVHMIGHSFFKSLLFMQVGYLIFMNFGQQDFRGYSFVGLSCPIIVQLQIVLSLFNLCGLLFTSGFFSKEYFISCFYGSSFDFFLSLLYFFGVFLTFCYCYRLFLVFFLKSYHSIYFGFVSNLFFVSGFFLVLFSIFFVFWWFVNLISLSFFFNRFEYLVVFFYFFIFFCVFRYFFKYFVLELVNKFFMDYYSLVIYKFIFNVNFYEYFFAGGIYYFLGVFRYFFFIFFSFLRGFHFSFMFFFMFFFVFFLV